MPASLAAKSAGAVNPYSVSNTTGTSNVKGYDSGNILGTVPPGKTGIKLVDATVQKATALTVDATAGVIGNSLTSTAGVGVTPTANSAQTYSNGLSLAPQTE